MPIIASNLANAPFGNILPGIVTWHIHKHAAACCMLRTQHELQQSILRPFWGLEFLNKHAAHTLGALTRFPSPGTIGRVP